MKYGIIHEFKRPVKTGRPCMKGEWEWVCVCTECADMGTGDLPSKSHYVLRFKISSLEFISLAQFHSPLLRPYPNTAAHWSDAGQRPSACTTSLWNTYREKTVVLGLVQVIVLYPQIDWCAEQSDIQFSQDSLLLQTPKLGHNYRHKNPIWNSQLMDSLLGTKASLGLWRNTSHDSSVPN
jgi:hypothetical protein